MPSTRRIPACLLSLSLLFGAVGAATAETDKSPYEWAHVSLDFARKEKAEQLRRFCERIHGLARQAREDDVMARFFDVNAQCCRLAQQRTPPAELTGKIDEFRKAFNDYYIRNWLAFYDILFVDTQGRITYTIRRDSNYGQELFEGELAETPLAQCLKKNPQEEVFIDFHFCGSSDEPAAFLVEPVTRDGRPLGWIVLQCAINKINSMFAGSEQLGATGETFLVNDEGFMLTESNFEGESTILKKRLSSENVRAKFREKEGRRTVTDYRGFTALTSFEVVEFLGTRWLVVAKVDEAQITTDHFMQHREYYAEKIVDCLAGLPVGDGGRPFATGGRRIIPVDMDEFVRASHGEVLKTVGVSTCTAVIATYPGKFGYLAHISPLDRVYGTDGTNLLGHVTKKIKTYDIYKYERRRVRFLVVARHFDSLANIVNKLVDEGFLLSQISVLYHPTAKCANVTYDYSENKINVQWVFDQTSAEECVYDAGDAHNVETVVRHFMGG